MSNERGERWAVLPEDEEGFSPEAESRRDEEEEYGDPRACARHPFFKMSSPDGMFDGWDCDRAAVADDVCF